MNHRVQYVVTALVGLMLLGCQKQTGSPEPTGHLRPELQAAIKVMRTPTQLLDNFGDELQVAYRLHLLLEELHFRPAPEDSAVFHRLVMNTNESAYARMCAAFMLLDSDLDARALLTNYAASDNLRHRFNTACVIEWYAWGARGEARDWAGLELVKMIETKSLELPSGEVHVTPGYEKNGFDMFDDSRPPLDKVLYTVGAIRERRAISGLKSMIERGDSGAAAAALGRIGDPAVGPFLMDFYWRDWPHGLSFADALAKLRYRPAVPRLLQQLKEPIDEYVGFDLLRDLVELGDATALPAMEAYVNGLAPGKSQKRGLAILVQLREQDPVAALLAAQKTEVDHDTQVELLRGLGRYPDERAIARLYSVSVTSDSTLLRGNAIRSLGRIGNQNALLTLVSLLETNTPAPKKFDKMAILEGRPADYSKREAERTLREATMRNFGMEPASWRLLIAENRQ